MDIRKGLKLTIAGETFMLVMIVLSSLVSHTWWRVGTIVWLVSLVPVTILWLR
jgi:hypothetical protein